MTNNMFFFLAYKVQQIGDLMQSVRRSNPAIFGPVPTAECVNILF